MVEITNSGSANPDFPIGRIAAAQPCDLCKSAPALLFCRKDTVFLCLACDAKLHAQTKHERVWMCEVCEQEPACVTCKVDAAAMCVTCDRDVHLANPLARRHVRIPVVPFYSSAESVVNAAAGSLLDPVFGYGAKEENDNREMIRNMTNADSQLSDCCFNFGFGFKDSVNDAGVPVRSNALVTSTSPTLVLDRRSNEINFHKCVYNVYNKDSHSHTVSSSLMDSSGVVPYVNSLLDVSNPLKRPVNGGRMFCAKDREARVLRYREKRKKRKFEKKIRYASRKAYAEIRPRIKGRFVKRTELISSLDVDRWWLTTESNAGFGAGVDYGIVSSF